MILSKNPKYIFIHIPKTGGTSISSNLIKNSKGVETGGVKKHLDYHTTAKQFKSMLPDYNEYFTFSVIRNPWDRLYSWYNFLNQQTNPSEEVKNQTSKDFKHWLMNCNHIMERTFTNDEEIIGGQKRPQLSWLTDENGKIIVNKVYKFEDLEKGFQDICINLHLPYLSLPKLRTSKHKNYKEAYDDEMKEFVYYYHNEDIKTFNYDF